MTQNLRKNYDDLFIRNDGNPILSAADWPYAVNTVFNAGATLLKDGTTLLLCRVEDRTGHSHLCAARSKNGIDHWEVDAAPTLMPDPDRHPEEIWGIEDPRITYLAELKKYAICYTSFSKGGPGVSIALTEDFHEFERLGVVMPPEDKDAALLPHRIDGRWVLIHRPSTPLGSHIWSSYSPDLRHWGDHRLVLQARRGAWWDANKIGLNAPPIETPHGWLMIYHGVRQSAAGGLYRLGLALLDSKCIEHCLLRSETWIFAPEKIYEREGDVGNVVFPCGLTLDPDGDTVHLYYGAADSYIALADGSLKKLLGWLEQNGRPERFPQ